MNISAQPENYGGVRFGAKVLNSGHSLASNLRLQKHRHSTRNSNIGPKSAEDSPAVCQNQKQISDYWLELDADFPFISWGQRVAEAGEQELVALRVHSEPRIDLL